jgi:hypothetical protein
VKLFNACGRFNVTKATAPRFSKVTVNVSEELVVEVMVQACQCAKKQNVPLTDRSVG